jgi:cytoskeletal protein CcmA (bactofilin family)
VFSTTSISLTGGTYVLSKEDFDTDETTPLLIKITGALVGPQTLVFPQSTRPYWIVNQTTGPYALTATTGAAAGRVIQQGGTTGIRVDGAAISIITVPVSPEGVAIGSSLFADISVSGTANVNNLNVAGNETVSGNLAVVGSATFGSMTGIALTITGAFSASGLNISGTGTFGALASSTAVFSSDVTVGGSLTIASALQANTLTLTGNGNVSGDFSVSGTLTAGTFAVSNFATTNLSVAGTATVAAANVTELNVLDSLTLASDPTQPLEAATKQYVDALASGIQWKASVNVATTANIALTGTQTIDGVGVVASNRVLVKNQTDPIENGIYVVSAGAWTRSTDADTDAEINGMVTFVSAGTTNGGQSWIIATSPATIAGPKTYVLFSANTAEVDWSLEQW